MACGEVGLQDRLSGVDAVEICGSDWAVVCSVVYGVDVFQMCADFSLSLSLDLLKNKSRPEAAASEAAAWVITERALKEKMKKEKEVKEKERKAREVSISFFSFT